MKLQYKNNQWVVGEVPKEPTRDELLICSYDRNKEIKEQYQKSLELAISQFKPIAPQDQEKVKFAIWDDDNQNPPPIDTLEDWQPDTYKLYDSGDLEFELYDTCIRNGDRLDCANETCWDLNECQKSPLIQYWKLKTL